MYIYIHESSIYIYMYSSMYMHSGLSIFHHQYVNVCFIYHLSVCIYKYKIPVLTIYLVTSIR